MTLGFGSVGGTAALAALIAGHTWLKLHSVGEPGAAGTTNPATETTRKQITYQTAAAGVSTSTNQLQWTSVAGSEDYLYFSVWSASTAGTFGYSGSITANPVTAGDTFTIEIGDVDVSVPLAA